MSAAATINPIALDERTAYHEAGHALMAHAVGLRVTKVTIVACPDARGRMDFRPMRWMNDLASPPTLHRQAMLQRLIMMYLAGPAAQGIYTGEHPTWGGNVDFDRAREWATYLTGASNDESGALLGWLWLRTQNVLARPHWRDAVKATAASLLARGTLTGLAFRQLLATGGQASHTTD